MREEIWAKQFPRGAKLLSYLYRILLCSESDLQSVDLLRRIFSRTADPMLRMINDFIFRGDFEDPFQEFFVEKLYKRGGTHYDFLFKLTSKPDEKIPVFLADTVQTIFKTGSTLHLLKKQSFIEGGGEDLAIKEYYDICSDSAFSTLRLFSQPTSNETQLEFQLTALKLRQELRQKRQDV